MSRYALMIIGLVAMSPGIRAQDMPLSTILVAGEGWKSAENTFVPVPLAMQAAFFKFPLEKPGVWTLRRDNGSVVVADAAGCHLWIYRIGKDKENSLAAGEPYYALDVRRDESKLAVTAMTTDRLNRLYAATERGIQIFDPTGRLCGAAANPAKEPVKKLQFIGDSEDTLLAKTESESFTRKIQTASPAPKKK